MAAANTLQASTEDVKAEEPSPFGTFDGSRRGSSASSDPVPTAQRDRRMYAPALLYHGLP